MVTAGPTYENIDPVRFIGNYSSGKMGFELASEFAERGAEVTLITGPVSIATPEISNIKRIDVGSAEEMYKEAKDNFGDCDIAVFAAAVSDYRPANKTSKKIKREKEEELTIHLVKNPDIAASLGRMKTGQFTVGFALETDNELENAGKKLVSKNLDMIVMNSLKDPEAGFMKDTNKITILTSSGDIIEYGAKSKREVARDIIDSILKIKRGNIEL